MTTASTTNGARTRRPSGTGVSLAAAAEAVRRGREHLIGRQQAGGWWKGVLRTNVTMDAEDLLMRQFLGILHRREPSSRRAGSARSSAPTAPGPTSHGGPGDLSTTIEAYVALRLAGDARRTRRTWWRREFVRGAGGSRRAGSSPASGSRCSVSGPGTTCRPCRRRSCCCRPGCRSTSTTGAAGPGRRSCRSPSSRRCARCARCLSVPELHVAPARRRRPRGPRGPGFTLLDKALKLYAVSADPPAARSVACGRPPSGSSPGRRTTAGGAASSRRGSTRSSRCTSWATRSSTRCVAAAIKGPRRVPRARVDTRTARPLARGLPVAGLGHLPRADRAARRRQHRRRPDAGRLGRLAARRGDPTSAATGRCAPDLEPGGWAFEFANDGYPDIDDTAEVVLALRTASRTTCPRQGRGRPRHRLDRRHAVQGRRLGRVRRRQHPAARREAAVLRLRRGHRPAVRGRHRPRRRDARHCEDAAPDSASRAAARRRLAARPPRRPTVRGSAAGAPTHVYGTGAVVPALVAAGVDPESAPIRGAVDWLVEHQNDRRRLGRGPAVLRRPAWRGRGDVDGVADRVGAARAAGRGRGALEHRPAARGSPGWPRPAARATAAGTRSTTPAPASPATSTSTTRCTGWCSRSARSAGT